MGNVSITLGSSFYSSGGDTINPKTWPAAPTGDGNSPGTGGGSGGSSGGGSGGSSYDQTTLDAIAYVNSVLSQGYYTTPYSATSSHHIDVGADASAWGSNTTASLGNLYDFDSGNTYTATYDRVSQIDSTTETSLDATWGSITPTIADPTGDQQFAFSSDGNTNQQANGYLNTSSPTGQGSGTYTPFLRLNESLILFIEFLWNDGYQTSQPSGITWSSYSGMPGSYSNLNDNSANSPSLAIDPSQSIISVIKDFAQLYAEASGTLDSGNSYSNSRAIFDYGSQDFMGSGYNWTFGLGRVTGITLNSNP